MTTMLQTLNETAAAYTSETRATNHHGQCCYFTEGKCCAVGRCLEDPRHFSHQIGAVAAFDRQYGLEAYLKPEYRGYPLAFWQALQVLHDWGNYWDENGLSEDGKKEVEQIKENFNL